MIRKMIRKIHDPELKIKYMTRNWTLVKNNQL